MLLFLMNLFVSIRRTISSSAPVHPPYYLTNPTIMQKSGCVTSYLLKVLLIITSHRFKPCWFMGSVSGNNAEYPAPYTVDLHPEPYP